MGQYFRKLSHKAKDDYVEVFGGIFNAFFFISLN